MPKSSMHITEPTDANVVRKRVSSSAGEPRSAVRPPPTGAVPTNRAESDTTRRGGSGRRTEDLATRWRLDFPLDARESSRFLTFSEELGGLIFSAPVEDESVAVVPAL